MTALSSLSGQGEIKGYVIWGKVEKGDPNLHQAYLFGGTNRKMEKKGVPHQLQAQQELNYLFSLSTAKTMTSEGPKRSTYTRKHFTDRGSGHVGLGGVGEKNSTG